MLHLGLNPPSGNLLALLVLNTDFNFICSQSHSAHCVNQCSDIYWGCWLLIQTPAVLMLLLVSQCVFSETVLNESECTAWLHMSYNSCTSPQLNHMLSLSLCLFPSKIYPLHYYDDPGNVCHVIFYCWISSLQPEKVIILSTETHYIYFLGHSAADLKVWSDSCCRGSGNQEPTNSSASCSAAVHF